MRGHSFFVVYQLKQFRTSGHATVPNLGRGKQLYPSPNENLKVKLKTVEVKTANTRLKMSKHNVSIYNYLYCEIFLDIPEVVGQRIMRILRFSQFFDQSFNCAFNLTYFMTQVILCSVATQLHVGSVRTVLQPCLSNLCEKERIVRSETWMIDFCK